MLTEFDKAIAAFLSSGLGLVAAWGLPVGPSTQNVILSLTPLVSLIATYMVPNKPAVTSDSKH